MISLIHQRVFLLPVRVHLLAGERGGSPAVKRLAFVVSPSRDTGDGDRF